MRGTAALAATCCSSLWPDSCSAGPFTLSDGHSKGKLENLKTQLILFPLISAPASLAGLQQSQVHGFPFDLGGQWPGGQDPRVPQVSTAP